jgi:hypothetical protein
MLRREMERERVGFGITGASQMQTCIAVVFAVRREHREAFFGTDFLRSPKGKVEWCHQ